MSTQQDRLAAFVDALSKEMMSFCGPIFITQGLKAYPREMIDNGTYSLIDTGQRRILVTCQHVWQAYLNYRAENPEAVLGVSLGEGDACIAFASPERQIIDADPELDLAVFDFEPSQIRVNNATVNHEKHWFPIRQWPIPKLADGEYIALMGFPGKRIQKDGMLCTFTTQVVPLKVSGVGDRQICVLNEGENVEVFTDIRGWLGGLSGSPAYTLNETGATLVGFVRSGFKPIDGPAARDDSSLFAGTLFLTHACFLQRDGTLARR